MKTFKQRRGQPEHKTEALRFALNEHLNDLRIVAELNARRLVETAEDRKTISTEDLMNEIRKSYVGRFRTKRLRKKHADLVKPVVKGASTR